MGTTSTQRFREFTVRPAEEPEVSLQPDGTIEVFWRSEDLTVLLSGEEALRLAGAMNSAVLVGSAG